MNLNMNIILRRHNIAPLSFWKSVSKISASVSWRGFKTLLNLCFLRSSIPDSGLEFFHQSSRVVLEVCFFFFPAPSFRDRVWQLVPFSPRVHLQISVSAPPFSLLLGSPLPWDKDHSHFQSRTADTEPWVMPVIQKPHQTPGTGHCAAPTREGVPHLPGGDFSVFPIQSPLEPSLSLRPNEHERKMKSLNAPRLQQLQQSEFTNDQQMSHKVKAPNRAPKLCGDNGAGGGYLEFRLFWKSENRTLTLPS